eukprot:348172-Rhodomonas_salina.1
MHGHGFGHDTQQQRISQLEYDLKTARLFVWGEVGFIATILTLSINASYANKRRMSAVLQRLGESEIHQLKNNGQQPATPSPSARSAVPIQQEAVREGVGQAQAPGKNVNMVPDDTGGDSG